jgi:hypothetical protein
MGHPVNSASLACPNDDLEKFPLDANIAMAIDLSQ